LAHPRLILADLKGIISAMSYKTLEVELENGRVHPAGAETLPAKAHALLTILSPQAVKPEAPAKSLGEAMRELGVMGRGEFTDLSTNPRHMDDFGTKAVSASPAFDFLEDPTEDVYTAADGKPFHDQR
jgi:hypothetical protein